MELPKYIQDKIKQQNEAIFKAHKLEMEIDNWCDKSGIDIYSKEYMESKKQLGEDNAITMIGGSVIKRLYQG
jgi:hypothetical protein